MVVLVAELVTVDIIVVGDLNFEIGKETDVDLETGKTSVVPTVLSFFVDDSDMDLGEDSQEENTEDCPVVLPFDNFIDEKGERNEDVEFDLVGGRDHGSKGLVVVAVSIIASCNSFFKDLSFDLNVLFLFIVDNRCPDNCCC